MAELQATNPFSINEQLKDLSNYKYSPNSIINISLNRLQDMLDGKIDLTDPTNPFTYLLETSCLNTAFSIQEYTTLTKRLYPRLANDTESLYLHMSDYDYLGIFSEPSYARVTFSVLLNDFKTKAHHDPFLNKYTIKIPRHSFVEVDKYSFMLPRSVVITISGSDIVDIKYDNVNFNSFIPTKTNYINFFIKKINQLETYLVFDIEMPELTAQATEIVVEKSIAFRNKIQYDENKKFYFLRAFYIEAGQWKEMIVTHTPYVYDINKPTCVIKVDEVNKEIEYYIPQIYIQNNMIGSIVKFVVYTTNAYIDVDFSEYRLDAFNIEYKEIFPDLELDAETKPFEELTKTVYIQQRVIGGKDAIPFNRLKQSVIDNSIGDRKLPITNKQIEFDATQYNYKLITDVDVVTNRIFLFKTNLPQPNTRYPITPILIDNIEFLTKISDLTDANSVKIISQNIITIEEGCIFKLENENLNILSNSEAATVKSLSATAAVTELNNNKYLATYYHYVLDLTDNEPQLRAYDLKSCSVLNINFEQLNTTVNLSINTVNSQIVKTATGYRILVAANASFYTQDYTEADLECYLIYPSNTGSNFYLKANLITVNNNLLVYEFLINSNFAINYNKEIDILNMKDQNNTTIYITTPLEAKFKILYTLKAASSTFTTSVIDTYIINSFLPPTSKGVSLDEITINFGVYLENLLSRVHVSNNNPPYETYSSDVYLTYTHNVYDSSNNIIHHAGEIVLDDDNNPIVLHRAGEVVLDSNSNPITLSPINTLYYLNLVLIDHRYNLANATNTVNYLNYARDYLRYQLTTNFTNLKNELLEVTQGFVTIPKSIFSTKVKTNLGVVSIDAAQSFTVKVYVHDQVYNDLTTKRYIELTIIDELDKYLSSNSIISQSVIHSSIFEMLKSYVKNIEFTKFTNKEITYFELLDPNVTLSIDKELVYENNIYDLKEKVDIIFVKV